VVLDDRPLIAIGAHIPVIKAWGFEPTALGFVWVKLNKRASFPILSERNFFFGGGLTTRKNVEYCVLCRRGQPKRLAADVRELIVSPVRESGRKPDETYRRIERYCAGPRLDLFGRESRQGWTVWGDEATLFDKAHRADSTRTISAKIAA
jgi:N6-adenosine-specific RNA methylase IME4